MMRKYLWCGLLFVMVAPARAEAPPKVVKETWDAVYIEKFRCGYARTTVHELERDGQKSYRTTLEMNLLMKRYGAVVRMRVESTVEETEAGKVVALSLTQIPDEGKKFTTTCTVKGDKLLIKPDGDPTGKTIAWNDKAIGPYKQEHLYVERRVKPGDKLDFLSFEPSLFAAVTMRLNVLPAEDIDLYETKMEEAKLKFESKKQKLLRIELQPDKFEYEGKAIQLPKQLQWVDKDYAIVRSEIDFGLGKMLLFHTTKELALLEGEDPAKMPDVGLNTVIPVAKVVDHLHDKTEAVYRITIKDDADAGTAFTTDARQQVKNVKNDSFELHVKAVRAPVLVDMAAAPDQEFLESSYFIDSADAKVKELATKAVGDEKDAWKKAQAIEGWVHKNMEGSSGIGFATASQVARDLKGDCRQHAMLTAALCRAQGIPARTALGLVYVRQSDKAAIFGFHMWTEVWIKGQWLGLDATLGEGSVGPGHLKITDHSWHNTQTLAPVLPVVRVIGKAQVEILSVK